MAKKDLGHPDMTAALGGEGTDNTLMTKSELVGYTSQIHTDNVLKVLNDRKVMRNKKDAKMIQMFGTAEEKFSRDLDIVLMSKQMQQEESYQMNINKEVNEMTKILTTADALQAQNSVKGVATKNITLKQIDRAIKYPNFEWEDTEFVKLPNREQVVGIMPDPVPEGEEIIAEVATSSRSGSTDSTKKRKKKSKKPKPAPHESIYPSPAVGLMHNPIPKTTGKKKKKKKAAEKEED